MRNKQFRALDCQKYGSKISLSEYERKLFSVHSTFSFLETSSQESHSRYGELDARIDYKLGVLFPTDKRKQLWKIIEKNDQNFLWLLVRGFLKNPLNPSGGLSKILIKQFSNVLDEEDIKSYFDITKIK